MREPKRERKKAKLEYLEAENRSLKRGNNDLIFEIGRKNGEMFKLNAELIKARDKISRLDQSKLKRYSWRQYLPNDRGRKRDLEKISRVSFSETVSKFVRDAILNGTIKIEPTENQNKENVMVYECTIWVKE